MATQPGQGALLTAIKVDLRRLHDGWMGLVFPRQRLTEHNVLGKWRPQTLTGRIWYWFWYLLGGPLITLLYPFVLAGFATRFYARRLDSTAARLGIIGVVAVSVVIWGALALVALIQLPWSEFLAVAAAGLVATVSAALAYVFARVGGRGTTVVFAYPFAMNAIFLPPIVAALFWPMLADVIFPYSEQVAIWILDNILYVGGINAWLRAEFTLEGAMFAAMWFAIAVPAGWILGVLVTLADVVRPKQRSGGADADADHRGSSAGN